MKYRSTRGGVSGLEFKEAVMTGLAPDGGLLVPHQIPNVSAQLKAWQGHSYQELATEIFTHFVGDIGQTDLRQLVDKSYSTFDTEAVTPVVQLGDEFVLELFHGPTLAFKDVALQLLGNLFEHILGETGGKLNILGATSGDTGSAAIAGVRGKSNIQIFVMFPEGKTSPMQERQMTSVLDSNVHNIGIQGSFDDCQLLLKQAFSDLDYKQAYSLGAVNSVNWARVMAQIVYYFYAWYRIGMPQKFEVAVPTGNFGNIFAGYLARSMGLPIHKLILATNSNDILARFFNTGRYQRGDVHFSLSPAMDIQVSSNFERYLYYKLDGDSGKVNEFMASFLNTGHASLNFNTRTFDDNFLAAAASDEETLSTIAHMYNEFDYLADPHTSVGMSVGARHKTPGMPLVYLSTAHPAKFEDAVQSAIPGVKPTHPTLEKLTGLPTRKEMLPADIDAVKAFIADNSPVVSDPLTD